MQKTKEAIIGKNRWSALESYIFSIEDNKISDPNIALDACKSILESVSKTILNDKGIEYESDSNIGYLVKSAFSALPVFGKLSEDEIMSTKSILGSFENISKNIGEFRNNHGFFSHGRDLQSEKFDRYLVELAISSSDILVSFLIISHAEDLKDRSRVYYEEHDEFNRYIDETAEELPVVRGNTLSPSQSLFTDIEAYKEELNNFMSDKETIILSLEESTEFVYTRSACADLFEFQEYLTDEEVLRLVNAAINNPQIYRILGHGHTKNMFTWLLENKADILSEEELDNFQKSFKKAIY